MSDSPPNDLHPPAGSRVRVALETVGTVEGSRLNLLTGRRELQIRPVRYPHMTVVFAVEDEQYDVTVELLPSAETGTIDRDARS